MKTPLKVVTAGSLLGFALPLCAGLPVAVATTTGTIDVQVASDYSATLAGATVKLYSSSTGLQVGSTLTADGEGHVQFPALSDGTYSAMASKSGYFSRYSTLVTVNDESPSTGTTIELPATSASVGRLKGTVTKDGSYVDAIVRAYPSTVTASTLDETSSASSTSTNGDGQYGLTLTPGSYKVQVYDWENESTRWVGPSGATADTATVITVTSGTTGTVPTVALADAASSSAPRVTGTVKNAAGTKLQDLNVALYPAGETDRASEIADVSTDSKGAFSFTTAEFKSYWHCGYDENYDTDGEFSIATYGTAQGAIDAATADGCTFDGHWHYDEGPIDAGNYRILVTDPLGEYVGEYYDNVAIPADDPETEADESGTVPASAAAVTVPATGAVATPTITLAKAPVTPVTTGFKGKLVTASGAPIPGWVSILSADTKRFAGEALVLRDGSWSVPATQLAPGSYVVLASSEGMKDAWVGGGTTTANAARQTLPVKGQKDLGTVKLFPWGTLSGKIALPALAGYDTSYRNVTLYDADGNAIDSVDTTLAGDYTFGNLDAGTFYVSAVGARGSLYEESYKPFVRQFWSGKYTVASANPITLGNGATARSINITLGNRLLATTAPSISGTAAVGKVLTARAGTWNTKIGTVFSYQWKRGSTLVSRAASYKVTKKDKRKSLVLVVTASDKNGNFVSGVSTSKAVKIK